MFILFFQKDAQKLTSNSACGSSYGRFSVLNICPGFGQSKLYFLMQVAFSTIIVTGGSSSYSQVTLGMQSMIHSDSAMPDPTRVSGHRTPDEVLKPPLPDRCIDGHRTPDATLILKPQLFGDFCIYGHRTPDAIPPAPADCQDDNTEAAHEDSRPVCLEPFDNPCPICHSFYPNRGCFCCHLL